MKLKNSLQKKIDATRSRADPLFPMIHSILVRVKAYLKEALDSHVLILATILHPSLRLDYFEFAFGSTLTETRLAKTLIETAYSRRKVEIEADRPLNVHNNLNGEHLTLGEEDEAFRKHKEQHRRTAANELRAYLEMAEEPSAEVGENCHMALSWWKVCISFLVLRHQLDLLMKFLCNLR